MPTTVHMEQAPAFDPQRFPPTRDRQGPVRHVPPPRTTFWLYWHPARTA